MEGNNDEKISNLLRSPARASKFKPIQLNIQAVKTLDLSSESQQNSKEEQEDEGDDNNDDDGNEIEDRRRVTQYEIQIQKPIMEMENSDQKVHKISRFSSQSPIQNVDKLQKVVPFYKLAQEMLTRDIDINNQVDFNVIKQLAALEHQSKRDVAILKKAFEYLTSMKNFRENLNEDSYDSLIKQLNIEEIGKFKPVFFFNDQPSHFYIIIKGQVQVLLPSPEHREELIQESELRFSNSLPFQKKSQPGTPSPGTPRNINSKINTSRSGSISLFNDSPGSEIQTPDEIEDQKLKLLYPHYEHKKIDLKTGDSFGEIAIINNSRRTATIVCKQDTVFVTLSKHSFDQILGNYHYKMREQKIQFLKNINIFNYISNTKIHSIFSQMEEMQLRFRNYIYQQGQESNYLYFIQEGNIQLNFFNETVSQRANQVRMAIERDVQSINEETGLKGDYGKLYVSKALSILSPGQLFGDLQFNYSGNLLRMHESLCISEKAIIYRVPKHKFHDILYMSQDCREIFQEDLQLKNTIIEQQLKKFEEVDEIIENQLNMDLVGTKLEYPNGLELAKTDQSINDFIVRSPICNSQTGKTDQNFKEIQRVGQCSNSLTKTQEINQIKQQIYTKSLQSYYNLQQLKTEISSPRPIFNNATLKQETSPFAKRVSISQNSNKLKFNQLPQTILQKKLSPVRNSVIQAQLGDLSIKNDEPTRTGISNSIEVRNLSGYLNNVAHEPQDVKPLFGLEDQLKVLFSDLQSTTQQLVLRQYLRDQYTFTKKNQIPQDRTQMKTQNSCFFPEKLVTEDSEKLAQKFRETQSSLRIRTEETEADTDTENEFQRKIRKLKENDLKATNSMKQICQQLGLSIGNNFQNETILLRNPEAVLNLGNVLQNKDSSCTFSAYAYRAFNFNSDTSDQDSTYAKNKRSIDCFNYQNSSSSSYINIKQNTIKNHPSSSNNNDSVQSPYKFQQRMMKIFNPHSNETRPETKESTSKDQINIHMKEFQHTRRKQLQSANFNKKKNIEELNQIKKLASDWNAVQTNLQQESQLENKQFQIITHSFQPVSPGFKHKFNTSHRLNPQTAKNMNFYSPLNFQTTLIKSFENQ